MVVHFPPPGFEVTISFDTPGRRLSGVGLHRSVAEAFVIALLDLANNMQGKSRAAETVRAGITQMWEEFLRLDPPATNIATELAVFLFDAFFGTLSASDTELSTHAGKKQRLVGALVSQSTQERQRDCWSSRVALQTSRTLAADVYGVIGKGNSDMGETDGVLITLGAGRDARKQNAYEKALFHATVLAFSPNLKNAYKNTVEELDDLPNKAQRPTVKAQRQLEVKRSFLETILGYKR
ncbi:hypothetical protein AGDE_13113 [Angomonas deanei]|uniref:Uncharacterized protein n=1 Tax=Angomonas deanei TaxID=59799 RepID=A0A7G2CHJ0_9TRYP|nr:hypothetical protein AGDE_13113 [Angomonas deanei]CAD2218527.1 hypothetical protein, conserved [Angomonas deanei]|eukprot:EPY22721.1 hypothetical protein AGDE_13113 [Angomonas deanei]